MREASLIGHVIEAYTIFNRNPSRPADSIIRHFYHDRKYLGSTDRRFIADAFFGTIKNFRRLGEIVCDATGEATIDPGLAVGAYFIFGDPRSIGAVAEALRNDKSAPERVVSEEVLRVMGDRDRETARLRNVPSNERLGVLYSFPLWFVDQLSVEYGQDKVEPLLVSLNGEAPIVLRANTLVVSDRDELAAELLREGFETTPSALVPQGLTLPRRMNVMGTKAFKRGAFEVQDEASQMVAPLAAITSSNAKILDFCAGAGGKTLHLAALMRNRGEIFATDVDPYKLEELKKRVRRSTAQNVRILTPEKRVSELDERIGWFDVVLLDVPCTGTGTLRRNPGIKWVLTQTMLQDLVEKQRAILTEAIPYLKPGGKLLYATCSILRAEGEEQIEWLNQIYPGTFTVETSLRTRPDVEGCDAFFAASLRKSKNPVPNG